MKFSDQYAVPPRETEAIVLGGGIAGLMAARVLSEHFSRVTILERDRLGRTAEARKGVPQGRHPHSLLVSGIWALEKRFPGITDALIRRGAPVVDIAKDARWFHFGGYKARFASGLTRPFASRPLLEHEVRQRVGALANVRILDGCVVEGLVPSEDRSRIVGIWFRQNGGSLVQSLGADLVVDANGRGSRTPEWLAALGFEQPAESAVKVDARYASRIYARRGDDLTDASALFVFPTPPHGRRFGLAVPIEGEKWMVMMGGWHGEAPDLEPREFEAFANTLEAPDIAALLRRARPLTDPIPHRFPSSVRRHYERVERLPAGLVVTGDALCSFNPIYAQGMSVAALEAEALHEALVETHVDAWRTLAPSFYRRAAELIDVPWMLAAGSDFQFPETEGDRRPLTPLINWYMGRLHRRATRDPVVYNTFIRVASLLEPPSSLFRAAIMLRVLFGGSVGAVNRESGIGNRKSQLAFDDSRFPIPDSRCTTTSS
jgi:2-polyprenyl-6-methoxyphenol hydroxylase-like FAD-dependent oxidoreductase